MPKYEIPYAYLAATNNPKQFKMFVVVLTQGGKNVTFNPPGSNGQVTIIDVKIEAAPGQTQTIFPYRYDLDLSGIFVDDSGIELNVLDKINQVMTWYYSAAEINTELPAGDIAFDCPYISLKRPPFATLERHPIVLVPSSKYDEKQSDSQLPATTTQKKQECKIALTPRLANKVPIWLEPSVNGYIYQVPMGSVPDDHYFEARVEIVGGVNTPPKSRLRSKYVVQQPGTTWIVQRIPKHKRKKQLK